MTTPEHAAPTPWWRNIGPALDDLARRPLALFVTLLAVNTLVFPYGGFIHDSRLYGVQVLNRVSGGDFDDDLFFRYGSQDRYSLFTPLAAPLAAAVGLPAAFFLLYLPFKALFLWGSQRFVLALNGPDRVSTLALLFLATARVDYGGHGLLYLNEPFVTPRLIAVALVLLALATLLESGGRASARRGRLFAYLRSLLLILAAFVLHPIMALGGLGVWCLWVAVEALPRRLFLIMTAVAVAAVVTVLLSPTLGYGLFGRMDGVWLARVAQVTPYNFPWDWYPEDWCRLAVTVVVVAGAALHFRTSRPAVFRLAASVLAVALAGLAATAWAGHMGYAFLFQAQPYRAVWLLPLLQIPLTFAAAADLWAARPGRGSAFALALVCLLVLTLVSSEVLTLLLCTLPVAALACRGLEGRPRSAYWPAQAVAASLLTALVVMSLFQAGTLVAFRATLLRHFEGFTAYRGFTWSLGPLVWAGLAAAALAGLPRPGPPGRLYQAACLAFFLTAQAGIFLISGTPGYQNRYQPYYEDARFLVGYLQTRHNLPAPPTIYWPTDRVHYLWLDLRARSYYARDQAAGVIFQKGTALEAVRRARTVRNFELARIRDEKLAVSAQKRQEIAVLYGANLDAAMPSRGELENLLRTEELDLVVLPYRFDGLYAATNGSIYIYERPRTEGNN